MNRFIRSHVRRVKIQQALHFIDGVFSIKESDGTIRETGEILRIR